MRKVDAIELFPRGFRTVGRKGAGKVSHAVDRENRRVIEGRDKEPRRDMRLMMLDTVELRLQVVTPAAQSSGQLIL